MPSLNRWHLNYDMKKLKEGNCWKACFDQKHNKYLGRIVCTNREGQTRELYEITREVFNRLGSFPDDYDNECLIRTGKLLFRFEDTIMVRWVPLTRYMTTAILKVTGMKRTNR